MFYVFKSYHRIGDNVDLNPNRHGVNSYALMNMEYSITSWNIGFGAYEDDYGFFMDGGTQSWPGPRSALWQTSRP